MNRRNARAHALQIASNLLEADTDNPGPFSHLDEEDADKVIAEVKVISQELSRQSQAMFNRINQFK